MNAKTMTSRIGLIALVASLVPFAIPTSAMAATTPGGSVSYTCQGDNDAQPTAMPVAFALTEPPSSVRPGDTLSLSGNLSITFPDAAAQQAQLLLSNNANIDATDFNIVVKVGKTTTSLKPSSVASTPSPIKTPYKLSAYVTYPGLTVPAGATGSISVQMPLVRAATSKVATVTDKVTFNAHVLQDSLIVPGRNVSCWTDKLGSGGTIGTIPVASAPAAATPASQPAAGAGPVGADGFTDVGSGLISGPAPDAGVPVTAAPADGGAPPAITGAAAPSQASTVTNVAAAIPSKTVSGETFVPGWLLALVISLFPAAAITYAVLQRRQLRQLTSTTTTSG